MATLVLKRVAYSKIRASFVLHFQPIRSINSSGWTHLSSVLFKNVVQKGMSERVIVKGANAVNDVFYNL